MDLTIAPQDNPSTTMDEAKRHRENLDAAGNDGELRMHTSASYSTLSPTIYDPSTELTEDDIFRMKKIRETKLGSDADGEFCSAVSLVDSTSNVDDRILITETNTEAADDNDDETEEMERADLTSDESDNKNGNNFESTAGEKNLGIVTVGDYSFHRSRSEPINLNASTVTQLHYSFVPAMAPAGADESAFKRAFADARVYLVGTAHFSAESQEDVRRTILATQPDVVMLELCSSRIAVLSMDEELLLREARKLDYNTMLNIIRQNGFLQGLLHILLLSASAHITRQLGMAPGGEFRVAYKASRQVTNCRVILGDRPIQITLQRALKSLSFYQKLRLFYRLITSNNSEITKEDVERCKEKDLLEELLLELTGEFPQLTQIFVTERDTYMTHVLHNVMHNTTVEKWNAAEHGKVQFEPVNAVAVVGIGHVAGIVERWNLQLDCSDLLTVPQPTRLQLAVRLTANATICGLLLYGAFRVGCFTTDKLLHLAAHRA